MPNPPPRARFQVHLLTAIVLMFTAGGLIWANIGGKNYPSGSRIVSDMDLEKLFSKERIYGWPAPMFALTNDGSYDTFDALWLLATAIINVIVTFLFLISIWYACEWFIRRRVLKKGP